jgi:prepilin-type N-terminal cleavage/methylation domain-containing protein
MNINQKAKICSPNSNSHILYSKSAFTIVELPPSLKLRRASLVSNKNVKQGFTIVELLVVIVVIGILAAITIVSYTGISNKATVASLQSDLTNASKLLKMYYVDYGVYPVIPTGANCPTYPTVNDKYCLKSSNGNSFTYLPNTGTTGSSVFTLSATNNTTTYTTTNNSAIISPAPLSPVADWLALPQGDHYGNYYDLVTKSWATVTRTTPKTIYDPAAQKIYDVPANYLAVNPRSDGKSGSEAVIEEARTNLVLNSSFEADSNNDGVPDNWSGAVLGTGATGDANLDVNNVYQSESYKLTTTNNLGQLYSTTSFSLTSGVTYTYSCWVKSNTTSALIDIMYGSGLWSQKYVTSSELNRWTRLSTTFTSTITGASGGVRIAIYGGAGTAYFDSCQLEVGSFATSYIPTTTTAVTRNTDLVTVPTTNWSSTTGSFIAVAGDNPNTIGYTNVYAGWDKDSNNRIDFADSNASNVVGWVVNGGVSVGGSGVRTTGYRTLAFTWYNGGSATAFLNGVARSGIGANVVTPTGLPATSSLGNNAGANIYNGPFQRLTVYNSALPSTSVSTVTSNIQNGP